MAQEDERPPGFTIRQYTGYFFWKDERWYECDLLGLFDYLLMHRGPKAVLGGRYVRDDLFYRIMKRATQEGIDG